MYIEMLKVSFNDGPCLVTERNQFFTRDFLLLRMGR